MTGGLAAGTLRKAFGMNEARRRLRATRQIGTTNMLERPLDSLTVGDIVRVTEGSLAGSHVKVLTVSYTIADGVQGGVQFQDGFERLYPAASLHRVGRHTMMADFHSRLERLPPPA